VVTPNHGDETTASKCASPSAQATSVPTTRPMRTATVAMKPRKTRWMITIRASVPSAYAMYVGLVGSSVGPAPPAASAAATGSSAMPMMVITEPVTTGGKNRISLEKNGAMRKVKIPATITAP